MTDKSDTHHLSLYLYTALLHCMQLNVKNAQQNGYCNEVWDICVDQKYTKSQQTNNWSQN